MPVVQNNVVLVTGGAGFIGSALIRELLSDGVTVVCYDNYLHGTFKNLQDLQKEFVRTNQLITIEGDIHNEHLLQETIRKYKVDYIINCVGDPFIPATNKYPERCYEINARVTEIILNIAKECNIKRIVHVSTCEVYGISDMPILSENEPINPSSTYAKSKYFAEIFCNRISSTFSSVSEHSTPVVITRLFNCYGPRATHPYIIPEIIQQLSTSNVLHLGNITERDFTYVHDTVRGIIAALTIDFRGVSHTSFNSIETINIGSGIAYNIGFLAERLANIMEVPNFCSGPQKLESAHFNKRYGKLSSKRGFTWESTSTTTQH